MSDYYEARMPTAAEVEAWQGPDETGAVRAWQLDGQPMSEWLLLSVREVYVIAWYMSLSENPPDWAVDGWALALPDEHGDRLRPVLVRDGEVIPQPWPVPWQSSPPHPSIPRPWQASDPATPLPADAACGPGAVLPLSDFRPGDVGEAVTDLKFCGDGCWVEAGERFTVARNRDADDHALLLPDGRDAVFWVDADQRARLISRAPNVQSDGPEIEEPPASLRESRERQGVRARTLTSRMTTSEAFAADAVIVDNGPRLTVDVPMMTSYVVDLQQLRRAVSDATGIPVNAPIEAMCEAVKRCSPCSK